MRMAPGALSPGPSLVIRYNLFVGDNEMICVKPASFWLPVLTSRIFPGSIVVSDVARQQENLAFPPDVR